MLRRLLLALTVVALAVPAFANHSWGGYHWGRTSNPFTLKLYDNIDPIWESYLSTAVGDWNKSTVLDYNVIWQSPLSSQKRCTSTTGVVEICNNTYGNNGWLGIAGISLSGSHITKGYTKLNDTYYAQATYNTPAYRQMVVCQEIAHDFGLDHQDETFTNTNLGTCMDYTNDPDGGAGGGSSNDPANTHPNQHDYDEIQTIYSHVDSTSTIAGNLLTAMLTQSVRPPSMDELTNDDLEDWGVPVHYARDGRPNYFVKPLGFNEDGAAIVDVVHVFWAPDAKRPNNE